MAVMRLANICNLRNYGNESRLHDYPLEGSAGPLPDCHRALLASDRHAYREKDLEDKDLKSVSSQWSVVRRNDLPNWTNQSKSP